MCLALLLAPGGGQAHDLKARYHVLPGCRVQVDAWYKWLLNKTTPCAGGTVEVLRGGTRLLEGTTNSQGVFVFTFTKPEDLVVKVRDDETGHAAPVLHIPAGELMPSYANHVAQAFVACLPPPTSRWTAAIVFGGFVNPPAEEKTAEDVAPRGEREGGASAGKLLLGVGLLLGVAVAFLLLQHVRAWRAGRSRSSAAP